MVHLPVAGQLWAQPQNLWACPQPYAQLEGSPTPWPNFAEGVWRVGGLWRTFGVCRSGPCMAVYLRRRAFARAAQPFLGRYHQPWGLTPHRERASMDGDDQLTDVAFRTWLKEL